MKSRDKIVLGIIVLLLIMAVSCTSSRYEISSVRNQPTAAELIRESKKTVENRNWLVFDKKFAEEMGIASWLVEAGDFWTPSEDEIMKLEDRLAGYLSQNAVQFYRQPPVWERLDEYQRQYIGFERGGKKLIYGNFFCNNLGIDWRQGLVIVQDGGECYFQVEYDAESGMFTMLLVNGES